MPITSIPFQTDIKAKMTAAFPEAYQPFTYKAPDETTQPGNGWKLTVNHTEADGEFIKLGSAKFVVLAIDLSVTPVIDGWIIEPDGTEHYINRVSPYPIKAGWKIYVQS